VRPKHSRQSSGNGGSPCKFLKSTPSFLSKVRLSPVYLCFNAPFSPVNHYSKYLYIPQALVQTLFVLAVLIRHLVFASCARIPTPQWVENLETAFPNDSYIPGHTARPQRCYSVPCSGQRMYWNTFTHSDTEKLEYTLEDNELTDKAGALCAQVIYRQRIAGAPHCRHAHGAT
jgi:hypothetical protein